MESAKQRDIGRTMDADPSATFKPQSPSWLYEGNPRDKRNYQHTEPASDFPIKQAHRIWADDENQYFAKVDPLVWGKSRRPHELDIPEGLDRDDGRIRTRRASDRLLNAPAFQNGSTTPVPTATFALYNDSCATADDKRQCYLHRLGGYGVMLMTQEDISSEKQLSGKQLAEFSDEQLAVIARGVDLTGSRLADLMQYKTGIRVTPAEAFQMVYGRTLKFGYVPAQGSGLTTAVGDAPTDPINPKNPIYITLTQNSFGPFARLDPSFVVVHELGHAFHNRHDGKTDHSYAPIAGQEFAAAVGADWSIDGPLTVRYDKIIVKGKSIPLDPAPGQPGKYILPQGYYSIPPDKRGFGVDPVYFRNESLGAGPSEGFADTFANFILNPEIILGTKRSKYFDKMPDWVQDIVQRP